jgi:glycerol kinase
MSYILALDQGTTSSRAIVFDCDGSIRAMAQQEFTQIYPRPGWVEQDPEEIWSSQYRMALEALEKAGITARDIAAIGIANQRETTLAWNRKTGKPLYNAIVWQDRRTSELCDRLKTEGLEALFTGRTGLVLDPYFSGTKLRWILENVEGARKLAASGDLAFGTVDTWLIWKLTGGAEHVTDISNASRTLLYNICTHDWDDKLLQLMGVPRKVLPEVRESSCVIAETAAGVFDRAIPIAGVAGDQQAALFGQGCFKPGMAKNTYGTGCFMLMNTGEQLIHSQSRLLSTVAWEMQERVEYALEGSVFIAGAVVQWLRDGLGLIQSSAEIESAALSVPDNGGVYLVPAFAGLGAPHWDPYARGAIVGLTMGAKAGHVARAALEAIAFQSADILSAMEADSGIKVNELRVDGGATVNDTLMQFQADLLGVPVKRPEMSQSTALGAAYLAGLAAGYWRGQEELSALGKNARVFEPSADRERVLAARAGWEKALERAKGWAKGKG